jgi:predicted nucleic acid-binding protein
MAAFPFLNTNVLLRYLTQDDPALSPRATALLTRIENHELTVRTTATVVFETVYTLQRFYRVPRHVIRETLLPILRLRSVRLRGKRRYRRTFDLYVNLPRLSFADCYHAAYMESQGLTDLISFDRDMDRVRAITRYEPDDQGTLMAGVRERRQSNDTGHE